LANVPYIPRAELDHFRNEERRIRDDQEERWKAYHILAAVVDQAGYTELGKAAVLKAIRCLDMISIERFGREEEINQAREKLLDWLHNYKRRAQVGTPSGA
jgi:hypothetical protein